MREPSGLTGLLATLLGLPDRGRDWGTPSFQSWLRNGEGGTSWPPEPSAGGLWLVDTRDRAARRDAALWSGPSGSYDAALVLAGRGAPGSALRRALRRVRRPGTRRWAPARVEALLGRTPRGVRVTRLGFEDGQETPTSFRAPGPGVKATGTAFLLTRSPAFSGPLWSFIGEALGEPRPTVGEVHLRERGAAVALVHTGAGARAVRVVPDPRLQEVVLRNHRVLAELRARMSNVTEFLRHTPEPGFAERHGSSLVLAETLLPGVLAWKVASGPHGRRIHDGATRFLRTLRAPPEAPRALPLDVVHGNLDEDLRTLERSTFVHRDVRERLVRELGEARAHLVDRRLPTHVTHGDFGYGNVLVDPRSGELTGVIDWDTARLQDFPGIDRVNLEIQIDRGSFPRAVRRVWEEGRAAEALTPGAERSLFGVAVARYVTRSLTYPDVYRAREHEFREALAWLARVPREGASPPG